MQGPLNMYNGYNQPLYESEPGRDNVVKKPNQPPWSTYGQNFYNPEQAQVPAAGGWQSKQPYGGVPAAPAAQPSKCACPQCHRAPWYPKEPEHTQDMMMMGGGVTAATDYPADYSYMRTTVPKPHPQVHYPNPSQYGPPRMPKQGAEYYERNDPYMRTLDPTSYRKLPEPRPKYWDGVNNMYPPPQQYQLPPGPCRYPSYNSPYYPYPGGSAAPGSQQYYPQSSHAQQHQYQHPQQQQQQQNYYGIVPNPARQMPPGSQAAAAYMKQQDASKISPLRLMRKKKGDSIEQLSPPRVAQTSDGAGPLDVRRFLSTWADEDEEATPEPLVVVECQEITEEQSELLRNYEQAAMRLVQDPAADIPNVVSESSLVRTEPLMVGGSRSDAPMAQPEQSEAAVIRPEPSVLRPTAVESRPELHMQWPEKPPDEVENSLRPELMVPRSEPFDMQPIGPSSRTEAIVMRPGAVSRTEPVLMWPKPSFARPEPVVVRPEPSFPQPSVVRPEPFVARTEYQTQAFIQRTEPVLRPESSLPRTEYNLMPPEASCQRTGPVSRPESSVAQTGPIVMRTEPTVTSPQVSVARTESVVPEVTVPRTESNAMPTISLPEVPSELPEGSLKPPSVRETSTVQTQPATQEESVLEKVLELSSMSPLPPQEPAVQAQPLTVVTSQETSVISKPPEPPCELKKTEAELGTNSAVPSPDSPHSGDSLPPLADLPTSEYRKNKFLDYDPQLPVRSSTGDASAVVSRPVSAPIQQRVETEPELKKPGKKRGRKPTIKFSIQKSQDLKISLRVMNESKVQEPCEALGHAADVDDTFTLRVENNDDLDVKAKRARKLKRKRLLADTYSVSAEERLSEVTADGFQVQESMDSSKIKLTFKRRKGDLKPSESLDQPVKRKRGRPPKTLSEKVAALKRAEICQSPEVAAAADTTTDHNGGPKSPTTSPQPRRFETSFRTQSESSSPKITSSCHITSPRSSTDSIERELNAIFNGSQEEAEETTHEEPVSSNDNVVDFYTVDIDSKELWRTERLSTVGKAVPLDEELKPSSESDTHFTHKVSRPGVICHGLDFSDEYDAGCEKPLDLRGGCNVVSPSPSVPPIAKSPSSPPHETAPSISAPTPVVSPSLSVLSNVNAPSPTVSPPVVILSDPSLVVATSHSVTAVVEDVLHCQQSPDSLPVAKNPEPDVVSSPKEFSDGSPDAVHSPERSPSQNLAHPPQEPTEKSAENVQSVSPKENNPNVETALFFSEEPTQILRQTEEVKSFFNEELISQVPNDKEETQIIPQETKASPEHAFSSVNKVLRRGPHTPDEPYVSNQTDDDVSFASSDEDYDKVILPCSPSITLVRSSNENLEECSIMPIVGSPENFRKDPSDPVVARKGPRTPDENGRDSFSAHSSVSCHSWISPLHSPPSDPQISHYFRRPPFQSPSSTPDKSSKRGSSPHTAHESPGVSRNSETEEIDPGRECFDISEGELPMLNSPERKSVSECDVSERIELELLKKTDVSSVRSFSVTAEEAENGCEDAADRIEDALLSEMGLDAQLPKIDEVSTKETHATDNPFENLQESEENDASQKIEDALLREMAAEGVEEESGNIADSCENAALPCSENEKAENDVFDRPEESLIDEESERIENALMADVAADNPLKKEENDKGTIVEEKKSISEETLIVSSAPTEVVIDEVGITSQALNEDVSEGFVAEKEMECQKTDQIIQSEEIETQSARKPEDESALNEIQEESVYRVKENVRERVEEPYLAMSFSSEEVVSSSADVVNEEEDRKALSSCDNCERGHQNVETLVESVEESCAEASEANEENADIHSKVKGDSLRYPSKDLSCEPSKNLVPEGTEGSNGDGMPSIEIAASCEPKEKSQDEKLKEEIAKSTKKSESVHHPKKLRRSSRVRISTEEREKLVISEKIVSTNSTKETEAKHVGVRRSARVSSSEKPKTSHRTDVPEEVPVPVRRSARVSSSEKPKTSHRTDVPEEVPVPEKRHRHVTFCDASKPAKKPKLSESLPECSKSESPQPVQSPRRRDSNDSKRPNVGMLFEDMLGKADLKLSRTRKISKSIPAAPKKDESGDVAKSMKASPNRRQSYESEPPQKSKIDLNDRKSGKSRKSTKSLRSEISREKSCEEICGAVLTHPTKPSSISSRRRSSGRKSSMASPPAGSPLKSEKLYAGKFKIKPKAKKTLPEKIPPESVLPEKHLIVDSPVVIKTKAISLETKSIFDPVVEPEVKSTSDPVGDSEIKSIFDPVVGPTTPEVTEGDQCVDMELDSDDNIVEEVISEEIIEPVEETIECKEVPMDEVEDGEIVEEDEVAEEFILVEGDGGDGFFVQGVLVEIADENAEMVEAAVEEPMAATEEVFETVDVETSDEAVDIVADEACETAKKIPANEEKKSGREQKTPEDLLETVDNIPLPPGSPPKESCFNLSEWLAKRLKPNHSPAHMLERCRSPFITEVLDLFRNPSPPSTPRTPSPIAINPSNPNFIDLRRCSDDRCSYEANEVVGEALPDESVFQNVMESCLANAKKYLNIDSNEDSWDNEEFLKTPDKPEETICKVREKLDEVIMANFVVTAEELWNGLEDPIRSKDVMFSSCEIASDVDGTNSGDVSVVFSPFHTTTEILPVDNWPYMEEEIPLSPQWQNSEEDIPLLEDSAESVIDNPLLPKFPSASAGLAQLDGIRSKLRQRIRKRSADTPSQSLPSPEADSECVSPVSELPLEPKSESTSSRSNNNHPPKSPVDLSPTYSNPEWQPKVVLSRLSPSEPIKDKVPLKSRRSSQIISCDKGRKLVKETTKHSPTSGKPSKMVSSDQPVVGEVPKTTTKKLTTDERNAEKIPKEKTVKSERVRRENGSARPSKVSSTKSESQCAKSEVSSTSPDDGSARKDRDSSSKPKSQASAESPHRKLSRSISSSSKKTEANGKLCETPAKVLEENISSDKEKQPRRSQTDIKQKSDAKPAAMRISHEKSAKPLTKPSTEKGLPVSKLCEDTKPESKGKSRHEHSSVKPPVERERRREEPDHPNHRSKLPEPVKTAERLPSLGAEKKELKSRLETESAIRPEYMRSRSCGGKPENSRVDRKRRGSLHHEERVVKRSGGPVAGTSQDNKPKTPWVCAVCGFDKAEEQYQHIREHYFNCQYCNLAFESEELFAQHLAIHHADVRRLHHCLLCELTFEREVDYFEHMTTREHRHLETVEKNTIQTLFSVMTGAPCPVLGPGVERPQWIPVDPNAVHFYHQATPLSLALQYWDIKQNMDIEE